MRFFGRAGFMQGHLTMVLTPSMGQWHLVYNGTGVPPLFANASYIAPPGAVSHLQVALNDLGSARITAITDIRAITAIAAITRNSPSPRHPSTSPTTHT